MGAEDNIFPFRPLVSWDICKVSYNLDKKMKQASFLASNYLLRAFLYDNSQAEYISPQLWIYNMQILNIRESWKLLPNV